GLAAMVADPGGTDREGDRGALPRQPERGPPLNGYAAGLSRADQVEVDLSFARFLVLAIDRTGAGEGVARPHLLLEADLEPADVLGPEPVGRPCRRRAGLDHCGRERHREAGRLGVLLVV